MTNKELNQKIKQAFSNAVPDVLDSVLSESREQKGKVIIMSETKRTYSWIKRFAKAAAVFVLLIGGTAGFHKYQTDYMVDSTISLDVNPSIEIKINQKERVLEVNAQNEDGRTVIGDMDFKGNSLDVTMNALVGSMLRNGYLSDIANSILISVDNNDYNRSTELQARLTDEINSILQTGTFSGAVLSQTISRSSELEQLADTYGITLGKAQLIHQITSQNAFYSFEDLVPLSINELNLLCESGNLNLDNVQSAGVASDKAYIGEEKAKEAALSHAGLSADAVTHYEVELDYEKNIMVYEIEFKSGGYEYDYDIDASTGAVIKHKKERDDDYVPPRKEPDDSGKSEPDSDKGTAGQGGSNNTAPKDEAGGTSGNKGGAEGLSYIGEGAAKSAALSHAGVSADRVEKYECELDREDGTMVYEIEFESEGYEYNYDIDASTGAVIKYEKEYDDDYAPPQNGGSGGGASNIGEGAAKSAALSHAGVSADSVSEYECELDEDDGIMVYEIEFKSGGYEYDYDIDAFTGAVVKYEKEEDD